MVVLHEGGPFQDPELGSCLTLGNELSDTCADTRADKARDFIGKGTQENCSAAWLEVSGFMVMGLVSRWSLANHSNSESFLVAHHRSAKMDASVRDSGKWTDTQCLLWTLPELLPLVVPY